MAIKQANRYDILAQWCSQALKSEGRHRGSGERKSPSGVHGGALVGIWGRRRPEPHTVAVKCFSTHVCCRVRPPSPLYPPPKSSSDLREFHDPTRLGQGGHGRGYATVLAGQLRKLEFILQVFSVIRPICSELSLRCCER